MVEGYLEHFEGKVVTVFYAASYMGEYNKGGIVILEDDGTISHILYEQNPEGEILQIPSR